LFGYWEKCDRDHSHYQQDQLSGLVTRKILLKPLHIYVVAAQTATDQMATGGPSFMFGDNLSVIKVSTNLSSRWKKRHNSLAYHRENYSSLPYQLLETSLLMF